MTLVNDTRIHTTHCVVCDQPQSIALRTADLDRFLNGALVQDAFPYLTADEREMHFLSGICGKCFDSMFPDE